MFLTFGLFSVKVDTGKLGLVRIDKSSKKLHGDTRANVGMLIKLYIKELSLHDLVALPYGIYRID